MFKNLSIRVRLAMAISFLGGLLVVGGAMGVTGVLTSNNDVKALYSTRLTSSVALAQANVALSRTRLYLYRIALEPTGADVPEETRIARNLLASARKAWDAYRALPVSGSDEARIAADTNVNFDALVAKGLDPMFSVIATHDAEKIPRVWLNIPLPLFIDVSAGMDLLGQLQVTAASATFNASQTRFHAFLWATIAGVLVALGAAAFAWWSSQQAVGMPLVRAVDHFRAISNGDLTTSVEIHSNDEMGQLMRGLRTMQHDLVKTIGVVRAGAESIDIAA
ncbi:Tar ligand binding domain-containing protein [Paraburkholderia sp. MM5384-R2]|uniref:Tar ligand binding domain-containing protein n=1 Tax=Paraburkholderia sp. MM5384-R2 TaxID=2723097 RepID=UPI001817E4FD|nr:methyl-accepting chemotaxis protein [Paraburkholderia sp. MM5384-R2]MBB5503508.1 methyl-accepting chemotaxis protein [Paraburkholderia sp. MM5384-R2]